MRSFKTFLAEQRRPIPIREAKVSVAGAGGASWGRSVGRLPRFPIAGQMFKGQTPRGTAAGAVDLLTRQPYRAANRYIKGKTGLNVPFRALAGGTVGGAGVNKSLDVFKREVNKYLRSQGLEAGRYTPEFDMPQPEFEPERQIPVPDYKEPRKAFGRTVPGINKAQEGPDTLGKFELLNISQKALGSTPGEKAENLGRVLTTQQGLEYLGPAVMDAAAMAVNPLIPATTGTLAPDTSLELRRRGTRAAARAYETLTGKKPAQIYSPEPTQADTQATDDFDKLRRAWLDAGREKERDRLAPPSTDLPKDPIARDVQARFQGMRQNVITGKPVNDTKASTTPSDEIDLNALLDF